MVQITETPAAGYVFNGWVGNGTGSYTGMSSNATVSLDANISETASFELQINSSLENITRPGPAANKTQSNATIASVISVLAAQLPNENISVTNVAVENNSNNSTYVFQAQVNAKILFLFPVQYSATVSVNGSNGR